MIALDFLVFEKVVSEFQNNSYFSLGNDCGSFDKYIENISKLNKLNF